MAKSYDIVKAWLKEYFYIEVLGDAAPPAFNDELNAAPIIEESSKFVGRLSKSAL